MWFYKPNERFEKLDFSPTNYSFFSYTALSNCILDKPTQKWQFWGTLSVFSSTFNRLHQRQPTAFTLF